MYCSQFMYKMIKKKPEPYRIDTTQAISARAPLAPFSALRIESHFVGSFTIDKKKHK